MAVREAWRGHFFEDFEVGDVYEHPLGRTVTTTENAWSTLLCCFCFMNTEATAALYFQLAIRVCDHAQFELLVEAALLWRQGLQGHRRYVHQ